MKNTRHTLILLAAMLPVVTFAATAPTITDTSNLDVPAPTNDYVSSYYTIEIQSGDQQNVVLNKKSQPLTIKVVDAETHEPVAGASVMWSISPAEAAQPSESSNKTNNDGIVSIVVTPLQAVDFSVNAAAGTPVSSDPSSNSINFNLRVKSARISLIDPQGFYGELDANRQALVNALDTACQDINDQDGGRNAKEDDLAATCQNIVNDVNGDSEGGREAFEIAASALSMMLPQATAAQSLISLDVEKSQHNNVNQRLGTLRSSTPNAKLASVNLNLQGQSLPINLEQAPNVASNATETPQIASPWGAFLDGTITQGDKDKDNLESGFESDAFEITGGVDYRLAANTVLGAALGYADSNTDFDAGQGSMDTTGYQLSLYGTQYQTENFYTDAILTYGRNSHESKEPVKYNNGNINIDQTFKGDTDGNLMALSVGGGYNYAVRSWTLAPYGRVEYRHVAIDGYEQEAADGSAGFGSGLTIEDHNIRSLTGNIGGQVSYAISTHSGVFIPQLRLDYAHEFNDNAREVKAYLTNSPNQDDFTIRSETPDTDYANALVGASAVFTGGRSAYAYYKTPIGLSQFSSNTFGLGLRWEF